MSDKQKNLLSLFFGIIVVGAVSVYIFYDLRKSTINVVQPITKPPEIKPISLDNQVSGDYKITVLPEEGSKKTSVSVKVPDLSLPVNNYSRLNETAFKTIAKNMAEISASLKKDSNNELGWLNLAVFRKMLGDYTGAVQILDYIIVSWPTDYAPYNNLADLYQFYIKNYPLAEKNWLKVIELKPDYVQAYTNLYALYKDLYKEKQGQSLPILLQGLAANPKSVDLMVYIARYYHSVGDKAQTKVYYDKAIYEARFQKNEQLESSLRSEATEISQ